MGRVRDFREFVRQTLVDERVAEPYEFSIANNGHQQVIFYVKGIRVKYQFPFSPSDHRSMLNSRSSVRKAIRTAAGHALSGASTKRSILDVGGMLPCEPHDVGGRGEGVRELAPSLRGSWDSCPGKTQKSARGS